MTPPDAVASTMNLPAIDADTGQIFDYEFAITGAEAIGQNPRMVTIMTGLSWEIGLPADDLAKRSYVGSSAERRSYQRKSVPNCQPELSQPCDIVMAKT